MISIELFCDFSVIEYILLQENGIFFILMIYWVKRYNICSKKLKFLRENLHRSKWLSSLARILILSPWGTNYNYPRYILSWTTLCVGQIVLPPSPLRQPRGQRKNVCDKYGRGTGKKEWLECLYRAGQGKYGVIRRPGQPPKKWCPWGCPGGGMGEEQFDRRITIG